MPTSSPSSLRISEPKHSLQRCFGAHMSVAGGLHKAIEAAAKLDMQTVQIFTKS